MSYINSYNDDESQRLSANGGSTTPFIGNLQAIRQSYGGPEIINGCASGLAMLPRSASEAAVDDETKFRQLPCRTFISVGTCPYRERCVYLHDPRCICRDAKTKTRRKNKDDVVLDSMFWPIMSYNSVATKLDNNRQPHVIQPYVVPPAQNDQYRRHDEAVYSMWMHFVDSCLAMSESPQVHGRADAAPCFAAPDLPINAYTKQPRLPVMRVLSGANRREVSREELMAAELGKLAVGGEFAAKIILKQITAGTFKIPSLPIVHHSNGMIDRPDALIIHAAMDARGHKVEEGFNGISPNAVNLRSPPAILVHDPSQLYPHHTHAPTPQAQVQHHPMSHLQHRLPTMTHLPRVDEYDAMSDHSDQFEEELFQHYNQRHHSLPSNQQPHNRYNHPHDPSYSNQYFRMEGGRQVTTTNMTQPPLSTQQPPTISNLTPAKVTSTSCFSPNSPTSLWMQQQHQDENDCENNLSNVYGKEYDNDYDYDQHHHSSHYRASSSSSSYSIL